MNKNYINFCKNLISEINKSNFPKEYIDFVTSLFTRQGYVLGVHKTKSIDFANNILKSGLKNSGANTLSNTVMWSSELLATLNYSIPSESYPSTILFMIPESCFDKENPTPLFTPSDKKVYMEDYEYTIDPSFIIGSFSMENDKYLYDSNVPNMFDPYDMRKYSDKHDSSELVPINKDDMSTIHKNNGFESIYKHEHPIMTFIKKIESKFMYESSSLALPPAPLSTQKYDSYKTYLENCSNVHLNSITQNNNNIKTEEKYNDLEK